MVDSVSAALSILAVPFSAQLVATLTGYVPKLPLSTSAVCLSISVVWLSSFGVLLIQFGVMLTAFSALLTVFI